MEETCDLGRMPRLQCGLVFRDPLRSFHATGIVGLTTLPESVTSAKPSCPYSLDSLSCPFDPPLLSLGPNSVRFMVLFSYDRSVK